MCSMVHRRATDLYDVGRNGGVRREEPEVGTRPKLVLKDDEEHYNSRSLSLSLCPGKHRNTFR